jgi:hypothetical protein
MWLVQRRSDKACSTAFADCLVFRLAQLRLRHAEFGQHKRQGCKVEHLKQDAEIQKALDQTTPPQETLTLPSKRKFFLFITFSGGCYWARGLKNLTLPP